MGLAKIQTERYFEDVRTKYGDKVEILSEYQGRERPITICYHCEKHGDTVKTMVAKNVFDRAFNPCKECKKEKKSIATASAHKMSKEDLYNRLVEYCKTWNGKVLEKEWVSAKTVYHFKCDNPEHPAFESTADSLFSGKHWCPYCCGRAGNFEKDMDDIIMSRNGIRIGKYINASTPVRVKCLEHDFEWDISLNNLQKGKWCPVCNLRLSERAVWDWYIEHHIDILPQYTFKDFIGEDNNKYRFDFGVFNKDGSLKYLLEIDDECHRGNSKKHINIRKSDRLKEEYCRLHHIRLIRIAISYSKIRVMPEQWYRDYMSDKLEQIENGGIEDWHSIDNIVYMDWTPARSTSMKNETLNKKCIDSVMLKEVIGSA